MTRFDESRFGTPLYTVTEAARIVDVPMTALAAWAQSGHVCRLPDRSMATIDPTAAHVTVAGADQPSIPFVGLAEALVLAALRRSGVSMQRIRPALRRLEEGLGMAHALASQKLRTDGARLLFEYSERYAADEGGRLARNLVAVRHGQWEFIEAVEVYLRCIEYGADGFASLIRVPAYNHAEVVADPTRACGAPIFERGGVRVDDVVERFRAGEPLVELSAEFGVPADQIDDALRVASRRAA